MNDITPFDLAPKTPDQIALEDAWNRHVRLTQLLEEVRAILATPDPWDEEPRGITIREDGTLEPVNAPVMPLYTAEQWKARQELNDYLSLVEAMEGGAA